MLLGLYQEKSMKRLMKNKNFRIAWHGLGLPCFLTVFIFAVLREAVIYPFISRYGEQTAAYTSYIHKSTATNIPHDIIHYYYVVDGKKYGCKCALSIVEKDSLTVKFLKECPRIHHIHRKNDKY